MKMYQCFRSLILIVLHNIKIFSQQIYILYYTFIIGIVTTIWCFETGGRVETIGTIIGQLQQLGNTLRVCKCVTDVAVYILKVYHTSPS